MHKFCLSLLALAAAGCSVASAQSSRGAQQPFVPVYNENFPDPFILPHGERFLAYATNANEGQANVQMAVSRDLTSWQPLRDDKGRLHDAMPVLPSWAKEGWTWAPEVIRNGERYLLYFTAREAKSGLQCTGVAESRDPMGPFVSDASEPLVCQRDLGGTIDATPYRDTDGQWYLYYKADANAVGKPTDIFVQRMTPDGLSLTGEVVPLLRNDREWEAHVIESPTMVKRDGRYVLFFSANHFGWEPHQRLSPYAMGYATCQGPMGPCTDSPKNPILYSFNDRRAGCLSGPGHQAVFEAMGREFIVFHAHIARGGCRNAMKGRAMYVAPLLWENGSPRIGNSLRLAPEKKGRK